MIINRKKSFLAGSLAFCFLLSVTSYIVYNQYIYSQRIQLKAVQNAALSAKISLESLLNRGMSGAKTLGFIVENYEIPENFELLASNLIKNDTNILAIELLEGGIIKKIHPFERNREVLGYDVLADSTRNREAYIAISRKSFYYAGPFLLKQGGFGVVGRLPLFKDSVFIGFSAVVIDFSDLVNSANIHNSESHLMEYQLVKVSPYNGHKERFISTDTNFESANSVAVEIPLGSWHLLVRPKKEFTLVALYYTAVFGFLVSLVAGIFIAYMFYVPQKLKSLVFERTKMLQKNNLVLTQNLKHIEEQNNRLREMSWTQSHLVRAPLARLLGLTYLLQRSEKLVPEDRELTEYIKLSAEEFDEVIKSAELKKEIPRP